jgi:hypothetical protein
VGGVEASGEQSAAWKGRRKEVTKLATKNSSDFEQNRDGKQEVKKRVTEIGMLQKTGLILRRAPSIPPSPHPLTPRWAPKAVALTPRWPGGSSLHYTRIHLGRQKSIRTGDPAQSTRTPSVTAETVTYPVSSHSPVTAETVTYLVSQSGYC